MNGLQDCLGYSDRLPLGLQAATAGELPASWTEQNLRVLAAIATLDERPRQDGEGGNTAEFERLHHKFDVMIELLGALLRAQSSLPPVQGLRLCAEGLSLSGSAPLLPSGSQVDVELHLHACAPAPWRWRAEVGERTADGQLELRFLPMSVALATALERHVFTRHRRSVADARSPARRAAGAQAP